MAGDKNKNRAHKDKKKESKANAENLVDNKNEVKGTRSLAPPPMQFKTGGSSKQTDGSGVEDSGGMYESQGAAFGVMGAAAPGGIAPNSNKKNIGGYKSNPSTSNDMGSPLSGRGRPGPASKISEGSNPFKIAPEKVAKKKKKKESPYKLKGAGKTKKAKGTKAPADNYKLPAKAKNKKKAGRKEKTSFKRKIPAAKGKLPDEVQARASNIFSTNFDSVNILENSQMAQKMGAQAFTQGNNVHFAPGKYNPKSKEGMELIGHELAHIVQQRNGKVKPTGVENGNAVNTDKGLEKEADEMGKKVASGDPLKRAAGGRNDKPQNEVIQKKEDGSASENQGPDNSDPTSGSEGEKDGNQKADPNAGKEEKGKKGKENDKAGANPPADAGAGGENPGSPADSGGSAGTPNDTNNGAPNITNVPTSPNSGASESPETAVVSSGGGVEGNYTEMFNELYTDVSLVNGMPVNFVEPPVDEDAIPVPDEEVEKKEEIKKEMEGKIHEDNIESAKAANKFISKSSNKTQNLIEEGKEIPQKIEPAKNSAIGIVQGAVSSEQGATRSAFSGFRSAVVSETAQVKGQIESEHQSTIASIESTYASNVAAVESSYASSIGSINAALGSQLALIESEYNNASAKILAIGKKAAADAKAMGAAKAAEYKARPKGGLFSSKKKKNKARANAAIQVADSYAKNLLEEAQGQSKDILKGKGPAIQQAQQLAAQQKQILGQQRDGALIALQETKSQAIEQADAAKVEFINTLSQASTGSIMELETKEGIQLESIAKLGNQKIAVIDALASEIASNLQKGTYEASQSLLEEYKRFKEDVDGTDAPDSEFFQKSVDNVEKTVTKSIDGAEKMISDGVSNAASGMMGQANGAASQIKSIAATGIADGQASRQAFSTTAQGIFSSAAEAFAQFDQMHTQQSNGAKSSAIEGFQKTVASTIEQFKASADAMKESLRDSVAKFDEALQDTVNNKLPADIEKHAEEAASKVSGGFLKMLIMIVIVVVVSVFLTPAVGAMVAGAGITGAAATIVTAAIIGGVTSALQTMANNVLTGQSLFKGVGKAFVTGAVNGALSAGLGAAMSGTFDKLRGLVQAASPVVQQLANMGINFLQGVATDVVMALAQGDPVNLGAIAKSNAISALADGAMETVDGFFDNLSAKVGEMEGPMKILAEAGIDLAKGTAKDIITSVASGEDLDFGAILKKNAIGAAQSAAGKGFEYLKGKAEGIENKALKMLATSGLGMLEGVTGDVLNALASGGDIDLGNILKMQAIGAVQSLGAEGFSMLKGHVDGMEDGLLKTVLDKGVDFGQGVAGDVLGALAKGEDVDLASILKTQAIVSAKELTPALFAKLKDQVGDIDNSSMKYILEKGIEFGEGATNGILASIESGGDVDFGEILKTQALVTGQDLASDGFSFLKNNVNDMEPGTAKYLLGHGLNFAENATNDVLGALQSGQDVDLGGILKAQGASSLQEMSPDLFNKLEEKVSGMDDGFMKYIADQGVDFAQASTDDILGALADGNDVDLGEILKTQALNSAQGMTPDLFNLVNDKIDGMDDGAMKYLLQQGSTFGEGSLNGILEAAQQGGDIAYGDIFKQQGILTGQRMAGDGLGALQGKVDGMDSGLPKYLSGKGLEFAGGATDDVFGALLSGNDVDFGSILSENGKATATSIGDDAKGLVMDKIGGLLGVDVMNTSTQDLNNILNNRAIQGESILTEGFNPLQGTGLENNPAILNLLGNSEGTTAPFGDFFGQQSGPIGLRASGITEPGGLSPLSNETAGISNASNETGISNEPGSPILANSQEQLTFAEEANLPIGVTPEEYVLGSLSEKYETGGRGAGTVSSGIGDLGGVSYGSYQIIGANMSGFLGGAGAEHASKFEGLTPGTPEFTAEWKSIATADPEGFHSLQHEYIQNTHYDVMVDNISSGDNAIEGLDIGGRSNTLKDVAWSTAVQHGPNNRVFNKALAGMDVSALSDAEIITAVYGERGKLNGDGDLAYFRRSSKAVQEGVAKRFENEQADALGMLEGELETRAMLPVMPENSSLVTAMLDNSINPFDTETSFDEVLAANSQSFLKDMGPEFYPADQEVMTMNEGMSEPIETQERSILENTKGPSTWEKLFGEKGTVVDPTTEFSQEDLGMEYFAHGLAYIDQNDFESTIGDDARSAHNNIISQLGRDPDGIKFIDGAYDFQAVLIPSNQEGVPAVLAIRGSASATDFATDLDFKQVGNEQYTRNAELITEALKGVEGKVVITGHSLGGALSQIVAVNNPEKVDRVVTFQAPGIAGSEVQKYEDLSEEEKFQVTHHQANNDIVDKGGWTHLPGTVYDHKLDGFINPIKAHTSYVFGTDTLSDMRSAYGFTDEVLKDVFDKDVFTGDPTVTKYNSYPDPLLGKATEIPRKGAGIIKEGIEGIYEGSQGIYNWGKDNLLPGSDSGAVQPPFSHESYFNTFKGPYHPSYTGDSPFVGPLMHQNSDSIQGSLFADPGVQISTQSGLIANNPVFDESRMRTELKGSEFQGAHTPELISAMETLYTNPKGDELKSALNTVAEVRGINSADMERQYNFAMDIRASGNEYAKLEAERKGEDYINYDVSPDLDLEKHPNFTGSPGQLRFGKVIGDVFGLDPVFGSLISPTGGIVGPGNDGVSDRDQENSTVLHGAVHDGAGYLINAHGIGPGYNYLERGYEKLGPYDPNSGQASGTAYWAGRNVDEQILATGGTYITNIFTGEGLGTNNIVESGLDVGDQNAIANFVDGNYLALAIDGYQAGQDIHEWGDEQYDNARGWTSDRIEDGAGLANDAWDSRPPWMFGGEDEGVTRNSGDPSIVSEDTDYSYGDGGGVLYVDDAGNTIVDNGTGAGVSLNDIDQGSLGDCYFLAAVGAIANTHPQLIKDMIHDNGDGTYDVTLHVNGDPGNAQVQTVSGEFPMKADGTTPAYSKYGDGNETYVMLLEKAYAQQQGGYGNIEGGFAGAAMEVLTGDSHTPHVLNNMSEDDIATQIELAITNGTPITAASRRHEDGSNKQILSDDLDIVSGHAYVIDGFDRETGMISLYNPWGTQHAELSVSDFQTHYERFHTLNVGEGDGGESNGLFGGFLNFDDGNTADATGPVPTLADQVRTAEDRLLNLSEREREHLINPMTNSSYTDNEIILAVDNAERRKYIDDEESLAAVVTFDQYSRVFENPTDAWFDGGIETDDIQELGRGEYDRDHVESQLRRMGVPATEMTATINEIVSAASVISNNSTLMRELDSANASNGEADGSFSRKDSEAYIMNKTLELAQNREGIVPERQAILDRFADAADANYFHNSVADVLTGNSNMGALTSGEQDHLLNNSIDKFLEADTFGANYNAIDNMGILLQRSGNTELINSYGESLLNRSIVLSREASNATSDDFGSNRYKREQAAFLSSQALMIMEDAGAQSDYMTNLSPENSYHLANALALGDSQLGQVINSGNGQYLRVTATERFLQNITDSGVTTDSSKTFVAEVFNDMTEHAYGLGSNPETVIANAMGLQRYPNDPAARREYSSQLSTVLNTDQGRELLSHNSDINPAVRQNIILQFMEDPAEFISNINKHDGSGYTNPHLMIDYSKPRVLDFMNRGDDPQVFTNENSLQNLIGASMSIPVNGVTDNMTEAQVREMETAIANGTYDQSLYAANSDAMNSINPILNSINHFSNGRNDVQVTVVPIQFSSEGSGPVDLPLYRVVDAGGNERFVDNTGGRYDSFDEWINENELPPGNVSFPADGHLHEGSTPLTSRNTPKTRDTVGEYILTGLDWAALVGGAVAGGVMIVGSGGALAPVVAGGAALYSGGRAAQQLAQSHDRGRSINPLTSWDAAGNWLGVAGGLLGAGSLASAARLGQGARLTSMLGTAAGGVDAASAVHDGGTLIKDWSKLTPEQRAQLALKVAFYGGSTAASRYYANRNAGLDGTTTTPDGVTTTPDGTTATPDGRTTTPDTPGGNLMGPGSTPITDTGGPGGRPSAPEGFEWVSRTNGDPYVRRVRGNGDVNPVPLERKPQIRFDAESNTFVHADNPSMVFNRDSGNFTGTDGGQYFYNAESRRFLPIDGTYPEAQFRAMVDEFNPQQTDRLSTAESFYDTYKGGGDYDSELRGINFDQPVDVINQGRVDQSTFDMFVKIDENTGQPVMSGGSGGGIRFGSYFTNPGADPSALGIDVTGRVRIRVVLGDPPPMLRSQSTDITSWTGNGSVYAGGETQYYSPTARDNIVSYEIVTD